MKIAVGVCRGVDSSLQQNSLVLPTVFLLTLSMRSCLCALQNKACICRKPLDSDAIETNEWFGLIWTMCSVIENIYSLLVKIFAESSGFFFPLKEKNTDKEEIKYIYLKMTKYINLISLQYQVFYKKGCERKDVKESMAR